MMNVRLWPDQIERLRATGNAAATIRYAVMRYRRGDFKRKLRNREVKRGIRMGTISLWKDPGVKPDQLRAILDAHFKTPDAVRLAEIDREIAELDKQIAEMMNLYAVRPDRAFILENDNEDTEIGDDEVPGYSPARKGNRA